MTQHAYQLIVFDFDGTLVDSQYTVVEAAEPLFPGVREGLTGLNEPEVRLGIATGKSRRGLLDRLQKHGLGRFLVTLQTEDSGRGKPHPERLLQAMVEAGACPRHTVMVGDTTFDMEMARNAGADALGVSWGYHESTELESAGTFSVLETFSQLPAAPYNLTEART